MVETFDLILSGGTCVTPGGRIEADVGTRDGRIAAIGDLGGVAAAETVDARGLHLLPGIIDTHVHFREPGLEHKEDIATGTAAAVLGGVTAAFDMPNTRPPTASAAALAEKCRRAKDRAWCDIAFYIAATPENVDRLATLERLPSAAGVKVFMGSSTGGLLVADDATLARVLAQGARRLAAQVQTHNPKRVSVATAEAADKLAALLRKARYSPVPSISVGEEGHCRVAAMAGVDLVVAGMVGAVGLAPTLAALQANRDVATANKETLVMAGAVIMREARQRKEIGRAHV